MLVGEESRDNARKEDRVQMFGAMWGILSLITLRLLSLRWYPSLGSSQNSSKGKDQVQKVYLGSNLRSLARVEDKVTRKANKGVTNECCRQLGLNHEACLQTFPPRGREAGHTPTDLNPHCIRDASAVLTPTVFVRQGYPHHVMVKAPR